MLEARIHTNQIGYQPGQLKHVVVANAPEARSYELVESSGAVVFSRPLGTPVRDADSGDRVARGDFSAFRTPGHYQVRVPGLGESYPFAIDPAAYHEALRLAARWFYLQRSGADKDDAATGFAHRADHTAPAILWDAAGQHPEQTFDVAGGWWDAGDYGRYMPPAATSLTALQYAYRFNPGFFRDGSLSLPESGNGVPDLFDELRWELRWLLKMQRADGAVHHKVSSSGFEGEVMPDATTLPLYLYDVSTWATAQFAGAAAEAAVLFQPFDPGFGKALVRAAERAWAWLQATPGIRPAGGYRNPDHSGGPYSRPGRDEAEYRLWAAAGLLRATGNRAYHHAFADGWQARPRDGEVYSLNWWGGRAFACVAYLESASGDPQLKAEIGATMAAQSEIVLDVIERTGYCVALTGDAGQFGYDWGSNALALGYGLWLLLTHQYAPDPRLVEGAAAQLNYVLGVNPLNKCYFTGAGGDPVQRPHHRPSIARGAALPGMVSGGPNAMNTGGDAQLQALFEAGTPPARRYADHKDSWATNEPTIYGNAAFAAVAAWFARLETEPG